MSQTIRLSQVPEGATFKYNGNVFTHDLVGRSGGGQIAVRTSDGRPMKLQASTQVTIVVDTPVEEVISKEVGEKHLELMEELETSFVDGSVEFPLDKLPEESEEEDEDEEKEVEED
jgi:hypothetical protein